MRPRDGRALDERWRGALRDAAAIDAVELDGVENRVGTRVRRRQRQRLASVGVTGFVVMALAVGFGAGVVRSVTSFEVGADLQGNRDVDGPGSTPTDPGGATPTVATTVAPTTAPQTTAGSRGARAGTPRSDVDGVALGSGDESGRGVRTVDGRTGSVGGRSPSTSSPTRGTLPPATNPSPTSPPTSPPPTDPPPTTVPEPPPPVGEPTPPGELVVALHDGGLWISRPTVNAGTVRVTYLDLRTAPPRSTTLSSSPSLVSLPAGSSADYDMRVLRAYTISGRDLQVGKAGTPLVTVVAPPRGPAAEPADRLTTVLSGRSFLFPYRDVGPAVFLPNRDQASPYVELQPGTITFDVQSPSGEKHELRIEGVSGFSVNIPVDATSGSGSVALGSGNYALYCRVTGHRTAGMNTILVVR